MANHYRKHSPLLRLILQALLRSSIDPRMKTLQMQTTIHDLSRVPCGALCVPVFVSSCSNTQDSLSLNALMLYDKMKQMAKLSVFTFALLT